MRPFIITNAIREQISKLVQYAEHNPFSMDDMLDIYNRQKAAAGFDENLRLHLPFGYRIVLSIEEQPKGKVRHLSCSVDEPGKLPSPAVVDELLKLLGFKYSLAEKKSMVALEEFAPGHEAINILEIIEQ